MIPAGSAIQPPMECTNRTGVIVKLGPADRLEEPLQHGGILAPDQGFEQGIGQSGKDGAGNHLWPELGPFGNASGNDRRYAGSEAEQEEIVHQVVTLGLAQQLFSRLEEGDTVGDRESYQEIDNCRNRPVGEDLDKGIDLVFLAHGANLQEGETGVHCKNHHRTKHQEKDIGAALQASHR